MEQGCSEPATTQEEELLQTLFKADGLIDLMLSKDLATIPVSTLCNCLLVTKTLISKAIEINEPPPPRSASVIPLLYNPDPLQKNLGSDILNKGNKINHKR